MAVKSEEKEAKWFRIGIFLLVAGVSTYVVALLLVFWSLGFPSTISITKAFETIRGNLGVLVSSVALIALGLALSFLSLSKKQMALAAKTVAAILLVGLIFGVAYIDWILGSYFRLGWIPTFLIGLAVFTVGVVLLTLLIRREERAENSV